MQIITQAITSFYLGRPTRGQFLCHRFNVRWSGHQETHPWRLDADGCPVYWTKFRLHAITRHVRKYVEDPDQATQEPTLPGSND